MPNRPEILMTPGPTPVPPAVLIAQSEPLVYHRGPGYGALLGEVIDGIRWQAAFNGSRHVWRRDARQQQQRRRGQRHNQRGQGRLASQSTMFGEPATPGRPCLVDSVLHLQAVEPTAAPAAGELDCRPEAFLQGQAPIGGEGCLSVRGPARYCEPERSQHRHRRWPPDHSRAAQPASHGQADQRQRAGNRPTNAEQ